MRHHSNEWISVSDLMAGVVASIMLILIVVIIKAKEIEIKATEAKAKATKKEINDKKEVEGFLKGFEKSNPTNGAVNLIRVVASQQKIRFEDQSFIRGSACTSQQIEGTTFAKLDEFFERNAEGIIYIEGHTDNRPVNTTIENYIDNCAVYSDNFVLSAARAGKIRELLIKTISKEFHNRIFIVGYGDSALIPGIRGDDARNRRVELRLLIRKFKEEQ